jgi:hypothetical protein
MGDGPTGNRRSASVIIGLELASIVEHNAMFPAWSICSYLHLKLVGEVRRDQQGLRDR